jgi:hypothetical protein
VSVRFSGSMSMHQPSSQESGLCIGEEIIGTPMWRWKKGCVFDTLCIDAGGRNSLK